MSLPLDLPVPGLNLGWGPHHRVVCGAADCSVNTVQINYETRSRLAVSKKKKYFRIRFRFHRYIRIFKKLRGVHPTVEFDSEVCITPRSQTPLCALYRGVKLRGVQLCIPPRSQAPRCASHRRVKWSKYLEKLRSVHLTADSDSAVCITPLSQTLRCASHCWVKLHGVHHTAESDSAVCIPPLSQYLPSVCFDSKFYKCNFSLMPKDINVKIIL